MTQNPKPPRARRKRVAADFPPEFLDAWMLASEGKLLLTMDSIGLARNMIQRLYAFRRAMAEENAALTAPWFLVDLRAHDEAGNIIVGKATNVPGKAIIKPANLAWKDQIREQVSQISKSGSGVGTPLGGIPSSPSSVQSPTQAEGDRVSETLSDLGYGTGEG